MRVLYTIGMQVLDTMRGMRVLDTIVIRVSGALFLTSYNTLGIHIRHLSFFSSSAPLIFNDFP